LEASDHERARIMTAILLRHPTLLADVEHAYVRLTLDPRIARIREAILAWADHADVLDSAGLTDHLTNSGLQADVEHVLASKPVPLPACASAEALPEEARTGWWHIFELSNAQQLQQEIEHARVEYVRDSTQENLRRFIGLLDEMTKIRRNNPGGDDLAAA
jgi:DNA primase